MIPQAVSDYRLAQTRLIFTTLALVRREWARMGDDLDAGWANAGPRIVTMTGAAQVGMANLADAYVPATLAEIGERVDAEAQFRPQSVVGAQSVDGLTYGSLDSLLYGAVTSARAAKVDSLTERLAVGRARLELLVHTQVSDAGKQAAGVAMFARPRVGYVRAVNPPCCKRCAVLAGKFFRVNQGFPRHPRCDCVHIPTTVAQPGGFGQSVEPSQIKDLTAAERKALEDGADLGRVVNANRKGKRSADGMTTTELKPNRGQRLTPEGIYRVSATREETLRRLRDNGYIT